MVLAARIPSGLRYSFAYPSVAEFLDSGVLLKARLNYQYIEWAHLARHVAKTAVEPTKWNAGCSRGTGDVDVWSW